MAPFDELVERAEGTAAETRRLVAVLQQTPLVAGTESLKSLVGDVLAKIAADEAASMSVQTEKQKLLKQEANLEQYELSIKQYQAKLEREEARLKDEEAKLDAKRKLDKVQTEKFSRQEKELRSKETEFEQQRKITEDLTAIMQELKLATESAKDLRPQLRELKGLTKDLATASTTTKEDHSDVTNAAQKLQDLLGANEALKAQLQEERDALRQGQQAVSDRQNELSRSEAELQRKQDAAKDTLEAHENFEAVKEALIKQHKAETDELKRRLLKFQNKRQELLDNLADRDRLLEEEKVAVATSQAELCNDFRVAAQLEANLNNSMTRAAETLRDLQKEGRQTAKYLTDRCNHLTDASNEIAPYLENIKKEYGAFKADFDRDDLKASVAAITEECSSIKGYLRKAREESDGVLAELISLEDRISDTQPFEVSDEEDVTMSQEPTDTSIGKRPYRPSSSDPSPRKEPSSKRARAEPGLSPILSRQASPEHQRHRQPSRPQGPTGLARYPFSGHDDPPRQVNPVAQAEARQLSLVVQVGNPPLNWKKHNNSLLAPQARNLIFRKPLELQQRSVSRHVCVGDLGDNFIRLARTMLLAKTDTSASKRWKLEQRAPQL
ncbi:MAG: hypothetical protein LQ338_006976 [Usnochroma carphineum]|nr:MAG: hypothetical protein LQ338_006976 [Usnochroma carphineum]